MSQQADERRLLVLDAKLKLINQKLSEIENQEKDYLKLKKGVDKIDDVYNRRQKWAVLVFMSCILLLFNNIYLYLLLNNVILFITGIFSILAFDLFLMSDFIRDKIARWN